MFPSLYQSHNYERYQGDIISKTSYVDRTDITLAEMGKILGYPCYKDYEEILKEDDIVVYHLLSILQHIESQIWRCPT